MKEEIFVLKEEAYRQVDTIMGEKYNMPHFREFCYKGAKIYAKDALVSWAIHRAEEDVLEKYRKEIIEKTKEYCDQYTWIKDKRRWSRCGKWLKKEMNNE